MKTMEQLEKMLEKEKEYIKQNDLKTLEYKRKIITKECNDMEKILIQAKKDIETLESHLIVLDQNTNEDLSRMKSSCERMNEIKNYTLRLQKTIEQEIESRDKIYEKIVN